MSLLPGDGGAVRRVISLHGEPVTFISAAVTVDTDTDWDDETTTTTTAELTALVTRTGRRSRRVAGETETDVLGDYVMFVDEDAEETITLRDAAGSDPATRVDYDGRRYEVVRVDRSITGVVRMEVAR